MINHIYSRYCHTKLINCLQLPPSITSFLNMHIKMYIKICEFQRGKATYICTYEQNYLLSHVVNSYSALVQAQIMVHNRVLSRI